MLLLVVIYESAFFFLDVNCKEDHMHMKVTAKKKKITGNSVCLDVNPKFRAQEKRTGIHAWVHFEAVKIWYFPVTNTKEAAELIHAEIQDFVF